MLRKGMRHVCMAMLRCAKKGRSSAVIGAHPLDIIQHLQSCASLASHQRVGNRRIEPDTQCFQGRLQSREVVDKCIWAAAGVKFVKVWLQLKPVQHFTQCIATRKVLHVCLS